MYSRGPVLFPTFATAAFHLVLSAAKAEPHVETIGDGRDVAAAEEMAATNGEDTVCTNGGDMVRLRGEVP